MIGVGSVDGVDDLKPSNIECLLWIKDCERLCVTEVMSWAAPVEVQDISY